MAETEEERAARHALARPLVEAFNTLAQQGRDEQLVEDAIRRHAVDMLALTVHRPQVREIFPNDMFAQAQWHMLRINALRCAPLDLAAKQLREEALAALDTNPKGKP